jgi:hypothetical protein
VESHDHAIRLKANARMTIGNVAPEAAVGADGLWSVRLSPAYVRALPTGELQVNATSKDKAGNISANASRTVIKQ